MTMWFKRHNEYGCPMCGRNPRIEEKWTQTGRDGWMVHIYQLQCPRKHCGTAWYTQLDDTTSQWKQIVDEYKKKGLK